jgi:4-carboxymuconolactone decarboxylase
MPELNEKAQRGVTTIAEMLGTEIANTLGNFATTDRFGAAMSRLALEFCYADNWNEDGLSRRERSLLLIAALIALRQPDELKNHLKLGLANGIRLEELEHILVHLVPYVGFPATATASAAVREILSEAIAKEDCGSACVDSAEKE